MAKPDIEAPACFYLGQEYDLNEKKVIPERDPVMYDARDLVTHGVVVGMTGSGKTGLCISLLEEAAIDGISCIILDIKGDLSNLLLQFPNLAPEDFIKWVNPEDARIQGISLQEHAAKLAERWKKGLEDSLQDVPRIKRLQDAGEWLVYTPGSDAGLPLSVLKNFAAPEGKVSRETLNQKIDATTSALLGLTGIVSDPVQSREHILIAQLLLHYWLKGESLDLAQLISRIQNPPMRTIGAFDMETFYPEKDRLKLAVSLNNILASPSFSTWIEGDPLDLGTLLSGGQKPRHLIFYLAHLEDSQRMFFLTLLLDEVLSWTRKQQGSSNLRAILYFDEVFGYLPPYPANPPTKQPLMTLLKQARAFGVGILLATQNPVDLDYKALSNAGTWMVGKLQTERDKARLMEGLEGIAAERGTLADRKYLENIISALGSRVFLLHDIHRPKPILFQTRWALSFLRGPMTREQIEELMQPIKDQRAAARPPEMMRDALPDQNIRDEDRRFKDQMPRTTPAPAASTRVPPILPNGIVPYYLPLQTDGIAPPAEGTQRALVYQARLLGFAEVVFADKKRSLEIRRGYRLIAEAPPANHPVSWMHAAPIAERLIDAPSGEAEWFSVPEGWNTARKLASLKKEFADHLYRYARQTLYENELLELLSVPGEDLAAFQRHCEEMAPQAAEAQIAREKPDFQQKFDALRAKIPPEEVSPPQPEPKAKSFWDFGILSFFRSPPPPPIVAPQPVDPKVRKAKDDLQRLETEWQKRRAQIFSEWKSAVNKYAELLLKPRKSDVVVSHFGLAWAPFWRNTLADGKMEIVPAYRVETNALKPNFAAENAGDSE